LVASRCAPKQIYWSHGSYEYSVPNIDKRISHSEKPVDCILEYESFSVAMDVERFHNPYRDPTLVAEERAKYPKDAFILGVIGRLAKVNSDEYLETVAKIMEQTPNTIFIAAGSGDKDTIKEKVEKLGISDRFYMPGFVDAHVYGHIIDLWCDTFPLKQGESLNEFIAKSKPFIPLNEGVGTTLDTTDPEMYHYMTTTYPEICFHHGENLIFFHEQRKCYTIDGYIACANDLIKDKVLCAKLGQMITTLLNEIASREKKSHLMRLFHVFSNKEER